MSTTPRVDKPAKSPPQELEPVKPETTVFFKPCFGITVQRCTLSVSVSAKADTPPPCPPACG